MLTVWLLVIPMVLTVVALVLAHRGARLAELLLVCLPALPLAVFYLLLPAFTTLRFVLPVFALLAVPVAAALVDLLIASRGTWRRVLVARNAAVLVTHLALMLPTATQVLDLQVKERAQEQRVAAALGPLINRKPCLVVGGARRATSYHLGCAVHLGLPSAPAVTGTTGARPRAPGGGGASPATTQRQLHGGLAADPGPSDAATDQGGRAAILSGEPTTGGGTRASGAHEPAGQGRVQRRVRSSGTSIHLGQGHAQDQGGSAGWVC